MNPRPAKPKPNKPKSQTFSAANLIIYINEYINICAFLFGT